MPRWSDDDDLDEDDFGDDVDDTDDEPTVPCPYCRREILEDLNRCPYCERYLSREDAPPARKPWWLVVGVVACLYVILRWTIGR